MCCKLFLAVLIWGVLSICGVNVSAQETKTQDAGAGGTHMSPVDLLKKDVSKLRKDHKILQNEVKNVRSSVSELKKSLKTLEGLPQALTEMNMKLESQMATVNSLSGEVYRVGAALDNKVDKGISGTIEVGQVSTDMKTYKQALQDLKNEVKILREMQSDIQSKASATSVQADHERQWKKVLHWQYWGQVGCGIALIALIVAL